MKDHLLAALRDGITRLASGGPIRWNFRADRLLKNYDRTGQVSYLDEAIDCLRHVVAAKPSNDRDPAMCLSNLGGALHTRFQRTGQDADLIEAVQAHRDAVAITRSNHPDRPMYLSNLGNALVSRFERTGQDADLDEAVQALRDAVAITRSNHPDRPMYLSNLGAALHTRFQRTGQDADLIEAVQAHRDAVAITRSNHPDRPMYLSNLGNALGSRFERTGSTADLDEAVQALRDAVAITRSNDPDRPMYLSNLAGVQRTRFERTGSTADLDEAVQALRDAVTSLPPNHPRRAGYLSNLGSVLDDRFKRTESNADLDEAVQALRDAVATTRTDHPSRDRAGHFNNLGIALQTRFKRTGSTADLDEAVQALRDAVTSLPPNHPRRAGIFNNLEVTLRYRFERTGHEADVNEAVELGRAAVAATPPNHPDRAMYLLNLGRSLHLRFEHTGQRADFDEAVGSWRLAVTTETVRPEIRIAAGHSWGELAMKTLDVQEAAAGYSAAVKLLPQLAWHGLEWSTQQDYLARWARLAADAAACTVRAGHPEQAVELLEQGRSVLWTQALHTRSDLTLLKERSPELATRLDQIREILDKPILDTSAGDGGHRMREERMALAREWDALVDQVRRLEGLEHFLAQTPFAKLRQAAAGGTVVVVNVSPYGCHAFVLAAQSPGIQVIELASLSHADALDRADALIDVLNRDRQPNRMPRDRERDRHTVHDILNWLWDSTAEPILSALGHTAPPAPDTPWPRLWWCPTGPLTLLPLHAAGHHQRLRRANVGHRQRTSSTVNQPTDSVRDRVISSYTPTLGALLRARQPGIRSRVQQLAIGIPDTPGHPVHLSAVEGELQVLAKYFPAPNGGRQLVANKATCDAVLSRLAYYPWVHFACHAIQNSINPAKSAFLLWDRPLTVSDLAAQRLDYPELAYLSACQTAAGGFRLGEESIHIAAALQLVGYRHIIATLWTIADQPAPDVADALYAILTAKGEPDAARAAEALHLAVGQLDAYPTEPLSWAPYVHIGV